MTDFVISEDMLRTWRNQCVAQPAHTNTDRCKTCQYRGQGVRDGCCDFDNSDMEKIFRSRPLSEALKAERERVLDKSNHIFIKEVDDISENGDANWGKCDMIDRIQTIWCKIDSLRGEP